MHDVDYLLFDGDLLRHEPQVEAWNELLRGQQCIVGATGESRVKAERRSSKAQGVIELNDEGVDCTVRQVEEFRASDEQGAVAKYLSDRRGPVARTSSLRSYNT